MVTIPGEKMVSDMIDGKVASQLMFDLIVNDDVPAWN
jgi:hypothetical protein